MLAVRTARQQSSELSDQLRNFGGAFLLLEVWTWSVVIKFVQRDPRLARQIYQRRGEEAKIHDKEYGYSALMLNAKKRAHECDHHQQRREYRTC